MSTPRKHHYVPRSYLARFTQTGAADGRLFVLDKGTRRQWPSTPGDSACERDFYMLEVDEGSEQDALAIEKFLGNIESIGSESITATLRDNCVPGGELRNKLVGFLAAMAMRVPGVLSRWDEANEQVMKSALWYLTATPQAWQAQVEAMRKEGVEVPEVSYEDIREFVLSEDYSIRLDQNTRLSTILHPLPELARELSRRHWTLVVAEPDAPDFICSDRPLTLCWNDSAPRPGRPPLGLGLRMTTAMFPLSRRAALLGMYEAPFPTTTVNPMLVGIVNAWTGLYASRFIYSAEPEFEVTLRNGLPGDQHDFLREFVQADANRATKHDR